MYDTLIIVLARTATSVYYWLSCVIIATPLLIQCLAEESVAMGKLMLHTRLLVLLTVTAPLLSVLYTGQSYLYPQVITTHE